MKSKNLILVIAIAVVLGVIFYASTGSQNNEGYMEELTEERKEKDSFMRNSKESPLSNDEKKDFKGLHYFPPDIKFRILADLVPVTDKKMVLLQTSDGKTERYLEYAYATFELNDVKNTLLILEMMQMGPARGKLFLAFGDETSARETYGAGRYLDVVKVPGSTNITLDFNRAYNPYCAYNNTYSCPLPPKDNLLQVAITAGEKTFH